MGIPQHDVSLITLTWNGIDIAKGVADGTELQEAKDRARWGTRLRGRGGVIRYRLPGSSGTLTITVDRESAVHRALLAALQLDIETGNVVGPFVVNDPNTGQKVVYEDAFIENDPDDVIATEGSTLDWVFHYNRKTPSPVTDLNANVVPTA